MGAHWDHEFLFKVHLRQVAALDAGWAGGHDEKWRRGELGAPSLLH